MVEKPKPGTEPSNLTILGRYILQPEIFGILSAQEKGAGGEIQLTDAMLALLKRQPFSALKYRGTDLRLRLQGGIPDRQCRLRAGPARYRRRFEGRDQEADLIASI